jgi:hypothetical protein
MKKHIIGLNYKDLHAIKHALAVALSQKQIQLDIIDGMKQYQKLTYDLKKDIEYETNLLKRITKRIEEIKDKYKIGD